MSSLQTSEIRACGSALPTRSAVQEASRRLLSDCRDEVRRFLETVLNAFPCEIPAGDFSASAIRATRQSLLAHGMTARTLSRRRLALETHCHGPGGESVSDVVKGRVWTTVAVNGPEMTLLLAYADLCDDDGGSIFGSDEYMSWRTNIPLRTIQAIKKKWRDSGALVPIGFYHPATKKSFLVDVAVTRGTGGRGWVVLYRLCLDPLPKKEPWRDTRKKKVAPDATFNPGQKVAGNAALTGERSQGVREKVAPDAQEGRIGAQHNKEESLDESSSSESLSPAATDTRRKDFIDDLKAYREHLSGPGSFQPTAKDFKNLDAWMKEHPKVDRELFRRCLDHRAKSVKAEQFNGAEEIYRWIARILEFSEGPLDRFAKPLDLSKGGKHGSSRPTEQEARERTSAAVSAGVEKFLRGKDAMGSQHVPRATPAKPGDPG